MAEANANTYDEVPYESFSFPQSHPDRLAVVATLLGMKPPPVDHCRVLELGCAAGANIIPMALGLPESTFLGIDLSARQVSDGQEVVNRLGSKNIELRRMSIEDVTPDLGTFDYIISHGVYSWVPPAVQDKIMEISARNLAPEGVAYISYNTYPGWHMRSMIRRMMLYHASHFTQPQARLQQARALLDFLVQSAEQENTPYGAILKSEAEVVRSSRDSYLFHDHLEEFNEPIYFYEFVERAKAKGLQYLGESDVAAMVPSHFRPEIQQVLKRLSPDIIHIEQYMDFLRNRMFRQTLLCHPHIKPDYRLSADKIRSLHVASPARAASARPNIHSTEPEQFMGLAGVNLTSRDPIVKAAMLYLSQVWPRAVPFEKLRDKARLDVDPSASAEASAIERDTRFLGECLLNFYASGTSCLIDLHQHPPRLAAEVSRRPTASPLARLQAARGNNVITLRHVTVALDEMDRQVLLLLDGSRERDAVLSALVEAVGQGTLLLAQHNQPIWEAARARPLLEGALDAKLRNLAYFALLVG